MTDVLFVCNHAGKCDSTECTHARPHIERQVEAGEGYYAKCHEVPCMCSSLDSMKHDTPVCEVWTGDFRNAAKAVAEGLI